MHTAFYRCLVLSPSRGLYSLRAQDKAERLSPVDLGIISWGVTDLSPSRGYTCRNTRDRGVTRSLQSWVLTIKTILVHLTDSRIEILIF